MKFIFGLLLAVLFFSNNTVLFILAYVFICFGLLLYTVLTVKEIKAKIILLVVYSAVLVLQLVHNTLIVFADNNTVIMSLSSRFAGTVFVLVPFIIHRIASERINSQTYLPSVQDIRVFTFNEAVENVNKINSIINKENIDEILQDMPRHNSFRYINQGSLTDEYFCAAYQTLEDQNVYIIISNTGSPASEIISMFTGKQYNHASLAFDRELTTILSYNGGERLYPPGLNMEMVKYFNKKQDSSIMVYSLAVSAEKKQKIIDNIREINTQGNAYNLMGLVFKFSFKPNIMFCSQFVYKMLKNAGLHYFDKKDGTIKPTDLIELDYYRKLRYEYEIKFN
jgi:energy-coupling factor transporter transmembrane protein EcfT